MEKTLSQYDAELNKCRDIFLKKTKDYGTAWRIMRPTSVTDQMYIKAERVRIIEETGENKVGESVDGEYMALVNYGIMGIIQLEVSKDEGLDVEYGKVVGWYDQHAEKARSLMIRKNHDYGEAWRNMRISSITDLILQKLLRMKQIEDNEGQTIISEGLDANYLDIINYALFALIRLEEKN